MVHKGITHYSGEFAANINLGQPGFLLITSSTDTHRPGSGGGINNKYYPKVNQWAAIKNVTDPAQGIATNGAVSVTVECFTGISGVTSAVTFFMGVGDIVFGPFSSVKVATGTVPKILAYIG